MAIELRWQVCGADWQFGRAAWMQFDGILVIPRKDAERALLEAEKIAAAESNVRSEMRTGISPLRSLETHGHV